MKIADGLKLIQNGWIRKPEGYRVRFDMLTQNGIEKGYSPPLEDKPLNSDVTAWRYAWKLSQATRREAEKEEDGTLYNITVVDDTDSKTLFYATGEEKIYNPRVIDSTGGDYTAEQKDTD